MASMPRGPSQVPLETLPVRASGRDPPEGHGLDAVRCGELLSIKTARGMLDQIQRLRSEFDIIGEMRERLIITENKRKKSPRAKLLNLLDAKSGDI